ncbi:protein required for cell viability [Scheffersomyces amazonensis]|uniref:protein required for cell viability n=1 Tax=Scheffersomyces amazonensis TaxID=1078765 RepID=UPI00315C87FF
MPPPKIEEVSSVKSEVDHVPEPKPIKKNPFATKQKRTTIRRKADDIYPVTKGLNKPQNVGNKPIDKLFIELEDAFGDKSYTTITVDSLYNKFFPNDEEDDKYQKRYKVVEHLLNKLIEIQKLSNENTPMNDKNLIRISLHDMKTFSKVVNLIIIHGVYPTIASFHIGIPFEKRNLREFSKTDFKLPEIEKLLPNSKLPNPTFQIEGLMLLIYHKFYQIFQIDSDVRDLLLKGTGYSDFLTIALALMTIPAINTRYDINDEFDSILRVPSTFELFQTFTLLASTPSPSYFKQPVLHILHTLHYNAPRNDGLLSLIEFVLGLRDQEEVNVEKFEHLANVVLSKPREIPTTDYFNVIGKQVYDLLVNINRPIVTSCLGYVLEKLWNRNPRVAKDFIIARIWNNLNPIDEPISEANLNNVVNVLISLTKKSLDSELLEAIFQPILLNLWSYYVYLNKSKRSSEVVLGILVSYLTTVKENQSYGLDVIAKNLIYEIENFHFEIGPNDLVQISLNSTNIQNSSKENRVNQFLADLDFNCEIFIKLLENLEDDTLVHQLFISILKRWLDTQQSQSESLEEQSPFLILIDLRLLESLTNKYKDSLASTPFEILQIIYNFLSVNIQRKTSPIKSELLVSSKEQGDSDDDDSDDDEEIDGDFMQQTLPTVLELLSAILSENTVELEETSIEVLKKIQKSLERFINGSGISPTIKSSSESLHSRIGILLNGETPVTNEEDAQKKILKRAVTNLNDPLVPIRAHGLYLLRQLIEMKTSVVSLDFVINLHLIQLKDNDPFIYINVIKGLESLIDWDEDQVLTIMTKLYESPEEDLDDRLKIGEVLLRYVQKYKELLTGDNAKRLVESCLNIIRRKSIKEEDQDNRLRMSSMSILGTTCKTNPLGIIGYLEDAIDCAIGILQLEKSKDESIMRRAAIVLLDDMIMGTSLTDNVPFPRKYQQNVINLLRYITQTDNDLLTRENAQQVLDSIHELASLSLTD